MSDEQHTVFTIGHSTHPIERFRQLLGAPGVGVVADVRRHPGSRRNPQFNAAALAESLAEDGIELVPLGTELGGRRKPSAPEAESGWRHPAFRAYAEHMQSAEFAAGLARLERLAAERPTAVMCAESDPSRCHRRLLADALLARGWSVHHILPDGALREHELTPFAVVEGDRVGYPPAQGTLEA